MPSNEKARSGKEWSERADRCQKDAIYGIYAATGFCVRDRMSMFRRIGISLFVVFLTGRLGAQGREPSEADALIHRVAESYLAKPYMEVTAYTRELRVDEVQDAESSVPVYRVGSAEYGRLVLTRRMPDAWRIVSQRERVSRGQALPSRTYAFGRLGTGESSMLVLNATTKAVARISIPEGMFQQEVNERIGDQTTQNALFKLLFNDDAKGRINWAVFHGWAAALRIEGTEEVDGVVLTRIASTWPSTSVIRLWIDAASLTLVRTLETPGEQDPRMRVSAEVKETLYRHDFGKGSADEDFDLDAGWAAATPNIASAAGFSPSTELFAAITHGGTIKPETPVARKPDAPKTPRNPPNEHPANPPNPGPGSTTAQSPAAPSAPVPEPEPIKVEEQRLTPEQMRAIVLIEGDGGAGTGFVARMRGVCFVITNLHVAGGNDNMRISTVSGEQVKTGPMFGAVGRDLALLRIEGDWTGATLDLCEDPIKIAKLGDKVVVVGNRRGGGVATQVSGVVQGIGPDKIEVNAPFQPGNSGSPMIHLPSGQVLGLASYSLTRKLDELDNSAASAPEQTNTAEAKSEQRWFGYRTDGNLKWEAIDQAKWQAQQRRIADFQEHSEAIYYAMQARFKEASRSAKVRVVVDRFEERASRSGNSRAAVMQDANEYFHGLRALTDVGVKELKTGDYYDFFRTSGYWESSIPDQLAAREDLARRIDAATENTSAFLTKLRR